MVEARFVLVCLLVPAFIAAATLTTEELGELVATAYETSERVDSRVATLARQLVMQQLFVEERVRSDGDSGIKQVRCHDERCPDKTGSIYSIRVKVMVMDMVMVMVTVTFSVTFTISNL